MALAIPLDHLIRDDVFADYADLARLGRVTRARVTQIMNLLNLAPDIQEEILFLPTAQQGRTPVIEKQVLLSPRWIGGNSGGCGGSGNTNLSDSDAEAAIHCATKSLE